MLVLVGSAAAWRPGLQLGVQWPAWKLLIDDANSGTAGWGAQSVQKDYTPEDEKDKVDSLPGFGRNGELPFGLYAG